MIPERYKALSTTQLCADPFFQEWVFHPLGNHDPVFLDMMLCGTAISQEVQAAKCHLLQHSNTCAFIAQCVQQYTRMKEDLHGSNSEKNFITAQDYWMSIQEVLTGYEFANNVEEIHFFKWIKPLFTGEKEYFSLLHHAELFAGADPAFWARQPAKLDKLLAENRNVINAYIDGDTRYDEWWYCRAQFRDRALHDITVGNYLGMSRYLRYAEMQM